MGKEKAMMSSKKYSNIWGLYTDSKKETKTTVSLTGHLQNRSHIVTGIPAFNIVY
jgi:hypothetical protein